MLRQVTRKAPKVMRKMYRPIEPIRLRVPARATTRACAAISPLGGPPQNRPLLACFDRPTKWLRQGKPFEHAQQIVNWAHWRSERDTAGRGVLGNMGQRTRMAARIRVAATSFSGSRQASGPACDRYQDPAPPSKRAIPYRWG